MVCPFPARKLRVLGGDIDRGIGAFEAHQEPLLLLTAILATPYLAKEMWGQVIGHPVFCATKHIDMSGPQANFFLQFPEGGFFMALSVINAALWHLPRPRHVDAFTYEDKPIFIGQEDTGTWPVGQVTFVCQDMSLQAQRGAGCRSATAVMGTRIKPRASRPAAQRLIALIVTG